VFFPGFFEHSAHHLSFPSFPPLAPQVTALQQHWLEEGDTLVLDNCSIHLSAEAILRPFGVNVARIPVYSPELNCIEWAWSILKRSVACVFLWLPCADRFSLLLSPPDFPVATSSAKIVRTQPSSRHLVNESWGRSTHPHFSATVGTCPPCDTKKYTCGDFRNPLLLFL
jgi:hypothetical protein